MESRRSLLNYIGIAILLAGLAAGEFIYWRSLRHGDATADNDEILREANPRDYDRMLGSQVGTFGKVLLQCELAVEKLGEPGPLAIAIGAVSIGVAGGCFAVASRMPRD